MESVDINEENLNQATIIAKVREISKYYYNQQFIQVESYDSNLIVEYDVLKQNQQWFIADSRVSNTY